MVHSGLVRPLLRPARSPSEGPAAPAEVAAVPILQQLPAARSHHLGRVRAAADEELTEYRSASVAVPLMAEAVVGHVYPSRPVVRPDSSTSSISRLCQNRHDLGMPRPELDMTSESDWISVSTGLGRQWRQGQLGNGFGPMLKYRLYRRPLYLNRFGFTPSGPLQGARNRKR